MSGKVDNALCSDPAELATYVEQFNEIKLVGGTCTVDDNPLAEVLNGAYNDKILEFNFTHRAAHGGDEDGDACSGKFGKLAS